MPDFNNNSSKIGSVVVVRGGVTGLAVHFTATRIIYQQKIEGHRGE